MMEIEALKKYKQILHKAWKVFDEFCSGNDINYFASSGTAIGAVRHNGIIPWDDDIDVYMFRKDYEKLLSLRNELPAGYSISALGDDDCIYPFIKFYDANTTLVEDEYTSNCRIGVFIDVFPLDEVAGTDSDVRAQKDEYNRLYKDFLLTFRYPELHNVKDWIQKRYFKTLFVSFLPLFIKKIIRNKFISYISKWSDETGDRLYFYNCSLDVDRELFPKEWFKGYHYVPFDDYKIRVNDNVHEYLTMLFGDYMTPPPVKDRICEHNHSYLNLKEGISAKEARIRKKKGETLVY